MVNITKVTVFLTGLLRHDSVVTLCTRYTKAIFGDFLLSSEQI
jgi:hypothetical protein